MKKTTFTVMALAAVMGIASMASCSGDAKTEKKANDTTKTATSARPVDNGFESNANIRYVDQEALQKDYTFYVRTLEDIQKIQTELQQYQAGLERQLQNKAAAIQQKAQSNGYLSEANYNADMQELQRLEQNLHAQLNKRLQADDERIGKLTQAVQDSIDHFIIRYNQKMKYDAILWKSAGMYFNPQLDITKEVVEGLNAANK